ncbi:MAG TPA: hypothetical protein VFN23_13110 [Ktedonobacteraceae bacterium]|nr:hypothetical protein [Ktedonobacteraceae bacterium]
MALNEPEALLQRIQEQWHTLIMAEQQGASIRELEELYAGYDRLLDNYKVCCEGAQVVSEGTEAGDQVHSQRKTRTPAKAGKTRKGRKNWKMAS